MLGCIGFFNVYALRVNLSVAVVDMATDLAWDNSFKGVVLSSFFYGYITTQIPGGFLACVYGGKWVLGIGVLGAGLLNMLIPLIAHNKPLVIVCRVLMGISEGVSYPAMHSLLSKFSPPLERSKVT